MGHPFCFAQAGLQDDPRPRREVQGNWISQIPVRIFYCEHLLSFHIIHFHYLQGPWDNSARADASGGGGSSAQWNPGEHDAEGCPQVVGEQ